MPQLNNPTDYDLYSHVLGEIVPAGGSVDVTDEQAERINTASGVWTVTAPATRSLSKRGGRVAEVSGAPVMETR